MSTEAAYNIRRIRKSRGLTLKEFGKLVYPVASDSVVSRWEKGVSLPSNSRLKQVAELGYMTVDELIGEELFECPRCENPNLKRSYNFCPVCRYELKKGGMGNEIKQ